MNINLPERIKSEDAFKLWLDQMLTPTLQAVSRAENKYEAMRLVEQASNFRADALEVWAQRRYIQEASKNAK